MDTSIATKFAKEVFAELGKGPISKVKAKEYLSQPWIDHLRSQATDKDLDSICTWIKPYDDEDLIALCIGIARNLEPKDFITFVKTVLKAQPGLNLRISAVLYLASKKAMSSSEWDVQAGAMKTKPEDLLRVARYFYNATNNEELRSAINTRRNSGNYDYNEPYYKLLLGLL